MIDLKQIKNRILVLNSTGTTLSAFKLVNVYNDSGTLKMRLANGDATVGSVYGATHLLLQTALNGESKYCTSFMVLDSVLGISGLTLGDVFLGPNGAMSSTPYTDEGDIDQCIGFAETTTKLFVNIALDVESYLAKALFSDINTGTDDNKYTTSKAIADSDIAFIGDIPVKATGAELDTGTDNDKFATAKALADSAYAKTSDIPVKATGAEINTGTDNDKMVTSKSIDDSYIGQTLKPNLRIKCDWLTGQVFN